MAIYICCVHCYQKLLVMYLYMSEAHSNYTTALLCDRVNVLMTSTIYRVNVLMTLTIYRVNVLMTLNIYRVNVLMTLTIYSQCAHDIDYL